MLVLQLTRVLGPLTSAGGPTASSLEVSLRWGVKAEWTGKARLFYDLLFSTATVGRRSYSVALGPDIALDLIDGPHAGWHLFDAEV